MIPQLLWIALMFIGFGMEIARHGKDKKPGKHDAWTSLIAYIISCAILWSGGFFDPIFKS